MNKILAFLNIKFLVSEDSFKNWRLILFVSFLALLVIFSVHSAENKIFKIQNKFLNPPEKLNIGENPGLKILTMIWTSKESIYKAIGLKGISFSENIKIDGVVEKDKTAQGYYINGAEKVKFDLKFFYIDEYIICYAHQSL